MRAFCRLVGEGFQFLGREFYTQGFGNFACHFVLYFENVFHFSIEAFRPKGKISARVNKLRADAQSGADPAHRAGKHIPRAQQLTDLRRGCRLVTESKNGGARKGV